MIKDNISNFITNQIFHNRLFYHSCQLTDFFSYLELNGVPSRELLEKSKLAYTPFFSDKSDKKKNINDKVFGNLGDFGRPFSYLNRAVPCVYGPISLVFNFSGFLDAIDISVTLKSASNSQYDRENGSLTDLEVNNLYQKNEPRHLKFESGTPELSATMENQLLSFDHLAWINVDWFGRGNLLEQVKETATRASISNVYIRENFDIDIYDWLWIALERNGPDFAKITTDGAIPENIRTWANKCQSTPPIKRQLELFWKYFKSGTANHINYPEILVDTDAG